MAIYVVYTTHPDEETAQKISAGLLDTGLIACANIFKMNAYFRWQGKQENTDEWVAIYKTRKCQIKKIVTHYGVSHPYETPCVVSWKVNANKAYEKWVKESTKNASYVPPKGTSDML
jgi:periplasmic divalent cation tolerance protein